MNEASQRIPCPKCQANNFPSSAVCWQCGQPLRAEQNQPPPGPPPQGPPGGYQPNYGPPSGPPPADNSQTLVILGFIAAVLGVLCCPVVFGVTAIILGVVAKNRGNPTGIWVIWAGVASMVIGIIVSIVVISANLNQFGGFNPNVYQQ